MMSRSIAATALLLAILCCPACRAPRAGSPYSPQSESLRDSLAAQRLTQRAAELIESKPQEAERLLREALSADLYHGPAHNNLGVIYLARGELYSAASEFEWARRLMPGNPDARMNLALTLERAGRISDAIDLYSAALESSPDHIHTIQALARLQLRHGRADQSTARHLSEIAFRGQSQEWREWAAQQLALDRAAPAP